MPLLQQNDVLFAHKALNIMPDLSASTRRVAGTIIDHFNKKTGQCDPSVGRLMQLLKISRAAIIRATNELDQFDLIQKRTHGGKSHRTAYAPNWAKFREIVENWDLGMKTGEGTVEGRSTVSELRPSKSQSRDLKGRKNETQTLRKNPSKKPVEACRSDTPKPKLPSVSQEIHKGLLNERNHNQQASLLLPINGGISHSRESVSLAKAQQRWEKDLMQQPPVIAEGIIDWLNSERIDQVTRAELGKPGGGLSYIFRQLTAEKNLA